MDKKAKLKKLVQIFGDLLKIKENEWLIDEILKTIGENWPTEQIAGHPLIQNIHEYCIEQKIDEQAKEFYKSFPLIAIRDTLIQDYKNMEHQRRRDDFENFCLHLYQQIEGISNYLFSKHINLFWENDKGKIASKSYYDTNQKKNVFPKEGGISLEKLVFEDVEKIEGWVAKRKFRAVLYYFYYGDKTLYDTYDFYRKFKLQDEIYQVRNQNHRGPSLSKPQGKTLNQVFSNKSQHYFKFYGFLYDFITKIENTLIEKKDQYKHLEIENNKTQSEDQRFASLGLDPKNRLDLTPDEIKDILDETEAQENNNQPTD